MTAAQELRSQANQLFAQADRLMDNGKGAAGAAKVHEARRLLREAEALEAR